MTAFIRNAKNDIGKSASEQQKVHDFIGTNNGTRARGKKAQHSNEKKRKKSQHQQQKYVFVHDKCAQIKRNPRFSGCDGAHRKVEMCNAAELVVESVCP